MSDTRSAATPSESPVRRRLRQTSFVLALVGLLMVPALYVSGGFEVWILGVEVRAHRPLRALWLFALGAAGFVAFGGRLSAAPHGAMAAFHGLIAAWDRHVVPWLPSHRGTVVTVALTVVLLGATFGTKSAGGADAYGYVSQATDIWLGGRLFIDQPFAADVPWPRARDTFMPLGYKAVFHDDVPSLVPTYSPGLPLIFAVVKAIGGLDAMYLVVPLFGGLLVLTTYGIGCRLGSRDAGLIGALLVAASPAVLFMLMPPMTDVPVAAAWAAAFYLLTGAGTRHALGAGLASSVAVLIRPNLVPLAVIAGLYYLPEVVSRATRARGVRRGLLFTAGVVPGMAAVAVLNTIWYGSPFLSGYGRLSDLFAWSHITPNFWRYLSWLLETQSPVALAGLAALLIPSRWLWPGLVERRRLVTAALFVYSIWAQYLAYLVFDAWWYLRFLLTVWPFMMVGVGAAAMALWRPGGRAMRLGVTAALAALLLFQVGIVRDKPIFNQWSGERRYIAVARMVERLTPPNSVIFSMQHSGTIRYYGERMTLRFDQLEPSWLDRAVAWLADHQAHPYLLVEPWEIEDVRRRFAGSETLARLDEPPVAVYEEPGRLFLFDLLGQSPGPAATVTGVDEGIRAVPPGPPPRVVFDPRRP
jgi:hypothetical protein